MARIQILELPTVYRENGDDETPFVLVVDQFVPDAVSWSDAGEYWQDAARKAGARSCILTEQTIDIPANETAAHLEGAVERVRQLHRPARYGQRTICVECSALGDGGITDNTPVPHPCDTILALDEDAEPVEA